MKLEERNVLGMTNGKLISELLRTQSSFSSFVRYSGSKSERELYRDLEHNLSLLVSEIRRRLPD